MTTFLSCDGGLFPIPYGCYCGPSEEDGDPTYTPIDAFDAHCQIHDQCYNVVRRPEVCNASAYFISYSWDLDENEEVSSIK